MDKIAIELSKLPFIEIINDLKNEIDSFRPISKDVEDKVFQKLKLDWNYNSNAIEGNKLNYGETVAFLMHGITAKGKTLKDHLDIKGHNEAINFLLSLVKEERDITESDIRALHKMILVEEYDVDAITQDGQTTKKRIKIGTYKTTPNSVRTRTGEMHYYASVEETPLLMADLMNWYNESKTNTEIHPLILASLFHFRFVAIHPFDDGNGRLARILMNLILMRNQFPPIVVKNEDKDSYYGVLAQADTQQYIPLAEYMSDLLKYSLNLYLKGIKGESIEEESDIDKEIALLKKSINKIVKERNLRNIVDVENRYNDSIIVLVHSIDKNLSKVKDLFFGISSMITYDADGMGISTPLWHIEEFIDAIKREKFTYHYCYYLNKFKDNTAFSIIDKMKFEFSRYTYNISYREYCIEKYYNEKITQEEINTFVNAIMKDILQQIKQATINQ